jgi:hypothetical protein
VDDPPGGHWQARIDEHPIIGVSDEVEIHHHGFQARDVGRDVHE